MRTLQALHRLARRFRRDEHGNVAVLFGVASIPIFGLTGMAVDYSTAGNVRSYLRAQADSAAIQVAVAQKDGKSVDTAALFSGMQAAGQGKFGLTMSFSGQWSADNKRYTVTGTATVPTSLAAVIGLVSGADSSKIELKPASTAEIRNPGMRPTWKNLDPEASDYNRIYFYCFDKNRVSQPDKGRRVETMTAYADNAGSTYQAYLPFCKDGEKLSMRLYNVRGMRTNPSKWDAGSAERYNYYSDTSSDGTKDVYNWADTNGNAITDSFGNPLKILETKLCDTLAQCMPGAGSTLPSGKNRDPQSASASCSEGKFMYFGWEDRPPNMKKPDGSFHWTDRDYDDIRYTMECPKATPYVVLAE